MCVHIAKLISNTLKLYVFCLGLANFFYYPRRPIPEKNCQVGCCRFALVLPAVFALLNSLAEILQTLRVFTGGRCVRYSDEVSHRFSPHFPIHCPLELAAAFSC